MFVLAQISGFIAWISLLISYYRKNTDKILIFHILAIVFYLLNYLFLGAWTGLFITIIELIRDFLYYKTDKDDLIFIITIPFHLILLIFSHDNIIEFIPIIASLIEGFTLTKKKNIVVPGAIIVYLLWIIYDISVKAYTGALTSGLIVISNIGILLNIIRGYKKINEFKITSRYSVTTETLKKMNSLKKDAYNNKNLLSESYEKNLYEINKLNLKFIRYKKELKGYFTTISISKNTSNKILKIKEKKEKYENLILKNNDGNILLIDSIILKEKYQNKKTEELITKNISKLLNSKYTNVIILASTEFEKNIAKKLNFIKLKELDDKSIIYSYKGK